MKPRIYKFVFLALERELEQRGYTTEEVEVFVERYSWFLSEYSLLRLLLRSKMPIDGCLQSLDFLVKRHKVLEEQIKRKSTVLDIGCGVGILACLLAKKDCRVHGIDIEEDNLTVARRLSEMLRVDKLCVFGRAESNTLPFSASTFDYVVLSWTLHDIKTEDREPLLSECVRVLKPKRRLLVLDPESQLNFEHLQEMMLKQPVKRTQLRTLSPIYDHGAIVKAVLAVYQKTTGH